MEILLHEEAVWYAPDYADNRDKPESDQCALLIKPMTASQLRRLEESQSKITRGKVNFARRYNAIRAKVLIDAILEVKHFAVVKVKGDQKERTEITDSKGFVEHAPEILLEEVLAAIKDQSLLEEGLLGN